MCQSSLFLSLLSLFLLFRAFIVFRRGLHVFTQGYQCAAQFLVLQMGVGFLFDDPSIGGGLLRRLIGILFEEFLPHLLILALRSLAPLRERDLRLLFLLLLLSLLRGGVL